MGGIGHRSTQNSKNGEEYERFFCWIFEILEGKKNNEGNGGPVSCKHFKGNVKLLKSIEIKDIKEGGKKGN
jgi:hypothetical protein